MTKTKWVQVVHVAITSDQTDRRKVYSDDGGEFIKFRGEKIYLRGRMPTIRETYALVAD